SQEDDSGGTVQHALGLLRTLYPCAQTSGKKSDSAKYQQGGNDKQAAEAEDLQGHRASCRRGELRQESQEKQRHFGIGQVHDDAPAVKLPFIPFGRLFVVGDTVRGVKGPP